jgi:hypothetical protein
VTGVIACGPQGPSPEDLAGVALFARFLKGEITEQEMMEGWEAIEGAAPVACGTMGAKTATQEGNDSGESSDQQ